MTYPETIKKKKYNSVMKTIGLVKKLEFSCKILWPTQE